MTEKDFAIRELKTKGIKKQVDECINSAFSKGFEACFEQKKEIEARAYQNGLVDAREALISLAETPSEERHSMFGTDAYYLIIRDHTINEVVERIRAYKEKQTIRKCTDCKHSKDGHVNDTETCHTCMWENQFDPKQTDEIKIGDEVIYNGNAPHKGEKGFVIGLCGEWVEVRYLSSWNCFGVHKDTLTKTGRHFDGIEDAMKQLGGETQ